MYKIAIGTNSRYKINAIESALHDLDIEFEVVADKVPSEVSEQPKEADETKQGSINRARNILEKHPDSDIGLGVEFGYEPIDGKYKMVCWASIIDQEGSVFSEQSSTLELPKKLHEGLEKDIDVDSQLEELLKEMHVKEVGRKYIEYLKKRRIIKECVLNVMLRYYFREELY